ncbi:hypothetical protein L798_08514 [Zootermopsis nevadensis]|uniref:Uncharacterized protein n=1 Tax=Zootermopsis nevadensis TaxID=136037 RepID=A0A067RC10_ZOONE|nr:hypothetical protein L798_08514 [Zootermopsis nevadensis]
MKEWFKKRDEYTHENLLNDLRVSEPGDFRNFLRLDEILKERLVTHLSPTPQSGFGPLRLPLVRGLERTPELLPLRD